MGLYEITEAGARLLLSTAQPNELTEKKRTDENENGKYSPVGLVVLVTRVNAQSGYTAHS